MSERRWAGREGVLLESEETEQKEDGRAVCGAGGPLSTGFPTPPSPAGEEGNAGQDQGCDLNTQQHSQGGSPRSGQGQRRRRRGPYSKQ